MVITLKIIKQKPHLSESLMMNVICVGVLRQFQSYPLQRLMLQGL